MLASTSAFFGRGLTRRYLHTTPLLAEKKERVVPSVEEVGWAFNHVEKKKGMYKPKHTVEEQIAYLQSRAFADAYKGQPLYMWYRRNWRGQYTYQPPPRMFCLDGDGRFKMNNACPVCRDEYLFFDYRSPKLIEMFLREGTVEPVDILRSGLCREQYVHLKAHLLQAKEHGTITFRLDFRNFNYKNWYPWWDGETHKEVSRTDVQLQDVRPDPIVYFPAFKPDTGLDWDMWWLRHDKFARKGK